MRLKETKKSAAVVMPGVDDVQVFSIRDHSPWCRPDGKVDYIRELVSRGLAEHIATRNPGATTWWVFMDGRWQSGVASKLLDGLAR